jgi:signal recognition particle receptor subunit beta
MASLNPLTREVVFKIVFYGPGLGGKTTTLQHIHAASKPEHVGKMVSLATPMDRTLYFDFLPLRMPLVHGMHVRLQLFTVPGQVYFGATRKLVLTGADGVVFVADSQAGRQDANLEALEDLVMNLAENNLALLSMPHTFHWNKRDIPDVVPIADLEKALNRQGAPSLGTVATTGEGVFAGLEKIARLVFQAYEAELPKSSADPSASASALPERPAPAPPAVEETTIADALRGLAEAPQRTRATPAEGLAPVKAAAAAPVSSLESIPNPIPRRPTGSFEAVSMSSPASQTAPSSKGASSSRGTSGSPTPPRVASSPGFPSATASAPPPTPAPASASSAVGAVPATLPRGGVPPAPPSGTALPREEGTRPGVGDPRRRDSRELVATSPPPSREGARDVAKDGFSFASVWPEGDRESVRQAEAALAAGDGAAALLVCDVLVTRLLASAAGLTGNAEAPREPGLVVLLLGLDGRRYLSFRSAVRAARAEERVAPSVALEAYGFALEVRWALAALGAPGTVVPAGPEAW